MNATGTPSLADLSNDFRRLFIDLTPNTLDAIERDAQSETEQLLAIRLRQIRRVLESNGVVLG